jgi:hypothetical protein
VKSGVLLTGGCAIALAGCGTTTVDGRKVQDQIRAQASGPPFDLSVAGVKCPAHRAAKKNDTFTCTMSLKNGETVPFKITQLDSKGHFSFHLGNEIATFVEATINRDLARRGFRVSSTCPQHVPVVRGAKFTCSMVWARGKHTNVQVKIIDSLGAFVRGRVHVG